MHRKTTPRVDRASPRSTSNCEGDGIVEEVQDLVWALIDDRITAEQIERLDQLVTRDARARVAYTECMHLHADLWSLFAVPPEADKGKAPPPIPPLATDALPGAELRPPMPDA